MSYDFTIGPSPIGTDQPCQLTFHEFMLYDSINWNQNGYICWDNTAKQFYLLPFPAMSQPVNASISMQPSIKKKGHK